MRRLPIVWSLLLAACATPFGHGEACLLADQERHGTEFAQPRQDIPGLPNFAQVSPTLYRSGQPNAAGFAAAKAMGIRTIVSLRWAASDRDELKGLGLKYIHISFSPWNAEDEDVIRFLRVVSDPAHQPVLVHCQHGADRTGMMVAIYRHLVQRWSMERAKRELDRFGFHSIFQNLIDYLDCLNCPQMWERVRNAPPVEVEIVP